MAVHLGVDLASIRADGLVTRRLFFTVTLGHRALMRVSGVSAKLRRYSLAGASRSIFPCTGYRDSGS